MFAVVSPVKTCSRDGDLLLLWCPPSPLVKVKHVVNVTTLVTVVPLVKAKSCGQAGELWFTVVPPGELRLTLSLQAWNKFIFLYISIANTVTSQMIVLVFHSQAETASILDVKYQSSNRLSKHNASAIQFR